jgi:glycine cleavage system regulatory protein
MFAANPNHRLPCFAVRLELIMTAYGPDRPNIVSRLTKKVLELGGHVEDSRMVWLAGDVSIRMLVTVDAT